MVDQSLVSWMLLFLSRSLDSTPVGWLSDDGSDKGAVGGASRDKDGVWYVICYYKISPRQSSQTNPGKQTSR